MADNKTNQNMAQGADNDATPSWLKQAQKKNSQYASDQTVVQATQAAAVTPATSVAVASPLEKIKALENHEVQAKLDDEGKIVLDNVTGSAEDEKAKKAEAELAGLKFEGIEDKPAIEKKVETSEQTAEEKTEVTAPATSSDVPDWLKNLSNAPEQAAVKGPTEPEKVEKPVEIADQSVATITPVVPSAAVETTKAVVPDKQKEQKNNLLESISTGLSNAVKTSREEIAKGKIAGISDSEITLENYEQSKAARDYAKSAVGKSKEQEMIAERKQLMDAEKIFQEGMATVRDLIAPSSMEVNYNYLRVEGMYARTFMVYSYPRYLDTNWLSPIVNFDATMDIAQFIYPIASDKIMRILTKKVTQMQAAMSMNAEKGLVRDPALETAYEDAEQLRTEIQRGQEKFFQFAMYITVYADELKKIDYISKQLESILGSKLVLTKRSDLRMEHGFNSTSPLCLDELEIYRNMNTGPLSTTFPFSSSDLTSNEGVLYGLNRHNDSLVIFDRFTLPNANSVCFAISGAGKSYAIKLEILRYLMLGVDVIVIDPENEYEELAKTVGGSYLRVSLTSDRRINPFDLPAPLKDEELQPGDLLRANIISLHGLLKVMLGGLTPTEEGLVDKALNDVYALKGITMEMIDPSNLPVPTMEDLHALLLSMDGATELAQRLEKFTRGTYSGIFNKPTNVDLKSGLMIFSIRDLEDSLRPIAMYIILNFIWNRIRSELKKRLMVVDEAWTMMQHEDSAKFLFGLVKRARKYYLGITTITQDVEDFIKSPYGRPIVTNSAMQLLLKQSPASINVLQKVFNLTDGEKYMLLNSGVGQGLFFAGLKHVAIQIIASYTEDKIITTNPEEILRGLKDKDEEKYE